MSFAKDKIQKTRTFHDIKIKILSLLETKIRFRTLKIENNLEVMKSQKNCQERGDRSLISHPSLFKIRVTLSETRSFLRQIITSDT